MIALVSKRPFVVNQKFSDSPPKQKRYMHNFSRKHAARTTENIFNYLTFQDAAHPIVLKPQIIQKYF